MKKVIVASDNHQNDKILQQIVINEKADFYLHAGDSELPKEKIHPFLTVLGNCDYEVYPVFRQIKIENYQIMITHGHLFSFEKIQWMAKERKIDIVIYGHTHIPKIEKIADVWYINPGSLARPRGFSKKSYLVITMDDTIDFKFIEI